MASGEADIDCRKPRYRPMLIGCPYHILCAQRSPDFRRIAPLIDRRTIAHTTARNQRSNYPIAPRSRRSMAALLLDLSGSSKQ
jgi:hypothetical protein